MIDLTEIERLAAQLTITFDTPDSVRQQIKQITLAQKQLRLIKQQLNLEIRSINQQATQARADTLASSIFDALGQRKAAGQVRATQRRRLQSQKQQKREPYLNLKQAIDQLILEGDRLKLLGEEYLADPDGFRPPAPLPPPSTPPKPLNLPPNFEQSLTRFWWVFLILGLGWLAGGGFGIVLAIPTLAISAYGAYLRFIFRV